jgi:hypothetical protein
MRTWSGLVKACVGGSMILGALGLSSLAAVPGCANDDAGNGTVDAAVPLGTGQNFCGFRTVGEAAGASCDTEARACDIGYVCGAFNQQGHCVCTGGKFACTDSTGADVAAGGEPACLSNGTGNDKACPASVATASAAACTVAGLLCTYQGLTCASGTKLTDQCQCDVNDKGTLAFKCDTQICPGSDGGTPPVVDAGPADAKTGG